MTKNRKDKPNQNQASGGKPDMIAYTVEARGEEKSSIWTQIGAAWTHKDNKGFDVRCKAFPVDGRLTLRFQDQVKEGEQPDFGNDGVSPSEP